jgi:hypothetical protein
MLWIRRLCTVPSGPPSSHPATVEPTAMIEPVAAASAPAPMMKLRSATRRRCAGLGRDLPVLPPALRARVRALLRAAVVI